MIAAVLQDKKWILKESTLVCVGKHWEVCGQKKFSWPSCRECASGLPNAGCKRTSLEASCQCNASRESTLLGVIVIGVHNLEPSRKELTHHQPEHRKRSSYAPGPPQPLWSHYFQPLMRAKEGRSGSITALFPPSELDVVLTFNLSSC